MGLDATLYFPDTELTNESVTMCIQRGLEPILLNPWGFSIEKRLRQRFQQGRPFVSTFHYIDIWKQTDHDFRQS